MSLAPVLADQHRVGVWQSVGRLMRLRLLIWAGDFRRASLKRKIGYGFLGLLLLAGLGLAFALSWFLLRFLESPELSRLVGGQADILESIPALIVTATFVGVFMTSFGVLLQVLYLAGDMDFLLSAPIPTRAVFLFKLIQAILPNFSLALLFGLPVLYGLGATTGYNWMYYPLALILLTGLALAAAGLSSLLVMAVVRVFPARRVAEVLGFMVGVLSFLCSQSGQFASWVGVPAQQAGQFLRLSASLNSDWSPLAWVGRSLVAIGEARWLAGIGLFVLSASFCLGIFLLALGAAEKLYLAGWTNVRSVPLKRKAAPHLLVAAQRKSRLTGLAERSIPQAVRGLVVKDFFVLRRDLSNLSNLVMPLILGVLYTVMLLRGGGKAPLGRGEAPEWFNQAMRNFMLYANVAIALFVSWSLVSRLALMSFSQEGRSYWIVKCAPISTRRLLAAKFLVAYLPGLILGWGFVLVMSLAKPGAFGVLVFSLLVVALCNAGVAGINLAFGIAGANLTWDDPRRMAGGVSGCLGALVSGLCLALALLLFFGSVLSLSALGAPEWIAQLVGLALGGGFSLACVFLPLVVVRKRVALLGEGG